MSAFQIVLDYLKVLIWPLLVLILFVILVRKFDIWLDRVINARKPPEGEPQEARQFTDFHSGLANELAQERKALQSAGDVGSRDRLKVLDRYAFEVQHPWTDSVGIGLLQAGDAGLPSEGLLRRILETDNPGVNIRAFPLASLRYNQLEADRLVRALQDIGLVTLEGEHYRLTPYGTRLFEKIQKDRTDFATKFYNAYSDAEDKATSDRSTQHIFAIQSGTDDASESPGAAPCPFSVSDENIYIGDCSPGVPITAGLRFLNVDLPPQANIREAYLEFIADGPYSNLIATSIRAEDSANPNTFSDVDRPRNRPATSASVPWRISSHEPWTLGEVRRSPDISPVLQAVIDRQDWRSGNALVILIAATPGGDSGTHRRFIGYVRGTENTEYRPPRLIVEYSLPESSAVSAARPTTG